jgi:carboxymethylenebutenolidase
MPSHTHTIPVGESGMALHLGLPDGAGRHPALVVIQHAPGVDTFIHSMVERFARAGYAAAAPDLYHRQDGSGGPIERMNRLKDVELIADVQATLNHLRNQPAIDGARIGIIGFCMGGRVAYLAAAVDARLKACIVYYGGNIGVPWGDNVPAPLARTKDIACPILFHFGAEDTNPSPQDRERLAAELTRHGKAHEFHEYRNAGHAFMNFTNTERYRQAAAESSWPRTLAFLQAHL